MSAIEGIMLKKTYPFLLGKGRNAHIAACQLARAIFVSSGTLKAEEKGRVCATNHDDWFFCRVNGPGAGVKDYDWSEEMTDGRLTIKPGVYRGSVGKQAGIQEPQRKHEEAARPVDGLPQTN